MLKIKGLDCVMTMDSHKCKCRISGNLCFNTEKTYTLFGYMRKLNVIFTYYPNSKATSL